MEQHTIDGVMERLADENQLLLENIDTNISHRDESKKKCKKRSKQNTSSKRRKKSAEVSEQTEHLSDEDNQFDDTAEDGLINSMPPYGDENETECEDAIDDELVLPDSTNNNGKTVRTKQELIDALEELKQQWTALDYRDTGLWLHRFGLTEEAFAQLQPGLLEAIWNKQDIAIMSLYGEFLESGLLDICQTSAEQLKFSSTFRLISDICANAYHMLEKQLVVRLLTNGFPIPSTYSVMRFIDFDSDMKVEQNYLQFLLIYAQENNFRKFNGNILQPVYTGNGIATQTWRVRETISKFVYNTPHRVPFGAQFKNFTAIRGCGNYCIDILTNTTDLPYLPEILPDRLVFSFSNGIYFARDDKFRKYSELDYAERTVVSSKYFPVAFPEVSESIGENEDSPVTQWRSILTPLFDSILKYQELNCGVIDWIYVFCGRMLYDIGQRDNWQAALFIFGTSNSGKSTIAQILNMFFEPQYVGNLTCGSFEPKFGLEAIYDKYMYTCTEVDQTFGMPQDILQKIISGEEVLVARKHRDAVNHKWSSHGMFFGNHFGKWNDARGAISRRFVVCEFPESVTKEDTNVYLLNEIKEKEIALLLKKMNCAYIDFTNKFAKKNIWSVLPPYFSKTSTKLKTAVNSVMKYILESKEVETTDNCNDLVPMSLFISLYRQFCGRTGSKLMDANSKETTEQVFDKLGLSVVPQSNYAYHGVLQSGYFISNLIVKDEVLIGRCLMKNNNSA
jgi:energy-coupling factor transporter ATP-binding protein EcfA2